MVDGIHSSQTFAAPVLIFSRLISSINYRFQFWPDFNLNVLFCLPLKNDFFRFPREIFSHLIPSVMRQYKAKHMSYVILVNLINS